MKEKLFHTIQLISKRFRTSAISAFSGQTAFFLMLSFFPYMLFLFSLLRLTPLSEQTLSNFLVSLLPFSLHETMQSIIHDIYQNSSGSILSITVISAIYLGSKAFISLVQGLNVMYQCAENRNYIVIRLFAILYSVILAILIILTLAFFVFGNWIYRQIITLFPIYANISKHIIHSRVWIGFIILFGFFFLLYAILPNCKWSPKRHIPGACFTTVGWILFSYCFSIYVEHFNNYASFYGTMTTIALLMVWLYACMYIVFLGGLLNDYLYRISS